MAERRSEPDVGEGSDPDRNGDDASALSVPVERYHIGPDATPTELLATARVYARAVVESHGLSVSVSRLEWEVSRRAKRRAGAVRYRDGEPTAIVLAWLQFRNRGWRATAATIRHELLHAHLLNERGDPSHGPTFRRLAATLETHVHCDRFVDPTWWVRCRDCDAEIARYRRSKLVTEPDRYRCGECGGRYRVIRTASENVDG
ncbi:SprT-like family protein [Halopenitus malekzadehii]|uniref:SprT-like family protein n=1 Tax=Halopenitus malekzadehii TaxID=1267564 RepID=A0A1H6IEV2_9EURY|nr:SprT-like domain-containing protein [Halopenitus malekzadehii]SEH47850.1 SprT-like family protein [Halopenitus malekzadehii]